MLTVWNILVDFSGVTKYQNITTLAHILTKNGYSTQKICHSRLILFRKSENQHPADSPKAIKAYLSRKTTGTGNRPERWIAFLTNKYTRTADRYVEDLSGGSHLSSVHQVIKKSKTIQSGRKLARRVQPLRPFANVSLFGKWACLFNYWFYNLMILVFDSFVSYFSFIAKWMAHVMREIFRFF